MSTTLKILLFLLAAHVLGGCAGFKEAQQRRRIAKAHAVLDAYKADTPPEQQLADLIDANPTLEGKTVRIVKERDTVRIPAATVTATLPAVSTPASDAAFIDSLIASAGVQLHAKDSATFAARLRAELLARPRLSRDTVTRSIGPITLKIWTDAHGRPQATVVKVEQKVGVEKVVHETGPVEVKKDITNLERLWLFVKDAGGLLVLLIIGGVVFIIVAMVRRKKQTVA